LKPAKENGLSVSYVIRKAVEAEVLDPKLKTQAELWEELIAWKEKVDARLQRIETVSSTLEKIVKILEVSTSGR